MTRVWRVIVCCAAALVGCGTSGAFEIEALPTHGVFYAGEAGQACLRLRVTAKEGEQLTRVVCSSGSTTKSAISAAYLYRSEFPFFSLHAKGEAAAQRVARSKAAAGKLVFTPAGGEKLKAGENYYWLVYDLAPAAKGEIHGTLVQAAGAKGEVVQPPKGKNGAYRADGTTPATPAVVFPYKYRIAPYVRPKWVCRNNKAMFTEEHLRYMTDFIVFGFTHDGVKLTDSHDTMDGATEECRRLALKLRGKGAGARVLAGFSCTERNNPMSAVMHNAEKRHALVRNMAALVLEQGYEGIDIDWEYPRENGRFKAQATWRKFAVFLGELRAALAGTGASISIAVTTRYDAPNIEALDGADFINSMSYGRRGEHSTKAAAQEDVDFLRRRGIPAAKIVLGLPFFSRDTRPKHADGGGLGYSAILRMHPNLPAGQNKFTHTETGDEHFFNGPELIRDKCKTFVLHQGCGGVCIWAYDTDVPITHPKSLSRALYSVLRRTSR